MDLYVKENQSCKLNKYEAPTLTITIILPSDIITGSKEVGDEWPWGGARDATFG